MLSGVLLLRIVAKSWSSATPVINAGNTSGDNKAAAAAPRPRNSWRATANAAGTPSSKAPAVAPSASIVLNHNDA